MNITHGLTLLSLIGVGYAVAHLLVTLQRDRALKSMRVNGLLRHVSEGDIRTAVKDVVLALLLLVIFASPFLAPVFGLPIFALVQQLDAIVLLTAFILGMALTRLHELRQP
jgi:hypothetical protein